MLSREARYITVVFLSSFFCRYFRDPRPAYRVISEAVSSFISEVAHSLKCGINRVCSFSVLFRTDVFKYLFEGKGRDCPHRFGLHNAFFPPDWYK